MPTTGVDFEKEFLQTLLADQGLKDLVGEKIFMMRVPNGMQLPIVVCWRISGTPANVLSGFSGLEQVQMQIDCLGRTYEEAKEVSKAVRKAIPNTGPAWGAHLMEDEDLYIKETNHYRVIQHWTAWYLEQE
jgi:hypothetical protein